MVRADRQLQYDRQNWEVARLILSEPERYQCAGLIQWAELVAAKPEPPEAILPKGRRGKQLKLTMDAR